VLDDLLAVLRALLALLLHLDDLAPDEPVRVHHRGVHRPRDVGPGGLDDLCDTLVEGVLRASGEVGHGGASERSYTPRSRRTQSNHGA